MALFKSTAQKLSFYNKLHKGSLFVLGAFTLFSGFLFFSSLFGFFYNFREWQSMQKLKETMAAEILMEDQDKAEREFEELLVIPKEYAHLVEEYNVKMDERMVLKQKEMMEKQQQEGLVMESV
uniref:Uncharacterized protein n=1 Tax=Percolomonas cosmopolitus TaxID=63605 RepID=A0A7S1KT92_9EUKA|eukprot:CAMPEP_0117448436 /NCGR_PEP_ID=MMETSP0759-20121206/7398_1 /TAXON_ID=63605 /ORGANISM="Percolomonas cosmopolitus, Strain WS" /LENGTH=122 /DNA_ID=CAMNT_0005240819 /DNA_START=16 /DNA_END=384 /DNA_ORIENTATION=-